MKRSDLEALLPEIFRRTIAPGTPIDAVLAAMEALLSPVEATVEAFPDQLSVERAEDAFVYMLARWLDLERICETDDYARPGLPGTVRFAPGVPQLRALIREVPDLVRLRGTVEGLRRFLTVATGLDGFEIRENPPDDAGVPRPFHVAIEAPGPAVAYRDLIERIIEQEKPAYVTAELHFGPRADAVVDNPAGNAEKEETEKTVRKAKRKKAQSS